MKTVKYIDLFSWVPGRIRISLICSLVMRMISSTTSRSLEHGIFEMWHGLAHCMLTCSLIHTFKFVDRFATSHHELLQSFTANKKNSHRRETYWVVCQFWNQVEVITHQRRQLWSRLEKMPFFPGTQSKFPSNIAKFPSISLCISLF